MLCLSIIVPFYNVEKYIERCIHSLYKQDIPYDEYEVICVDDCSLDGSRAIVERLQGKYDTLKLLTSPENLRQGGARNIGLSAAHGTYVWFVDSDDCIVPNTLSYLLKVAVSNDLDVLQFNYSSTVSTEESLCEEVFHIVSGEEYLFDNVNRLTWVDKIVGPWRQMYRRDFLQQYKLKFIEYAQFEDTDYVLRSFVLARRVASTKVVAYVYCANEYSTTAMGSSVKLAWQVNQFARCADLLHSICSIEGREMVKSMCANSVTAIRVRIKNLSVVRKIDYIKSLKDVHNLHSLVSWRTWLAIRYAITWFI